MYLKVNEGSYWSSYSQRDSLLHEEQYLSAWFEWERNMGPTSSTYYAGSETLEFYVPASIAAFYTFVLILALVLHLMSLWCCKAQRVRYFSSQKNPADEAKYRPSEDEYGMGNDLKQFEMAKKHSRW